MGCCNRGFSSVFAVFSAVLYVFLALFIYSVNGRFEVFPYFGFAVFTCCLLVIGTCAKISVVLLVYIVFDLFRFLLQLGVLACLIYICRTRNEGIVEIIFGFPGFFNFVDNHKQDFLKDVDVDKYLNVALISLAVLMVFDALLTLLKIALAYSLRSEMKRDSRRRAIRFSA
uniref:NADH dehydrogenase subunit 6 n=1 Tax=Panagrolaimus sp. JU765 TaxID=591449 RepID=A0AC34RDN2_9BILA